MRKVLFSICCILALGACSPAPTSTPTTVPPTAAPTETLAPVFTLSSPAFANGEPIPAVYTCKGNNTSPQLIWNEPPAGTKTFAIIVDDPDGAGYTHWVIYDIPAASRGLPENVTKDQQALSDGVFQGFNGSTIFGYEGMCPPSNTHHYSFRLYALDIVLEKKQGIGKKLLEQAMTGHILAQTELMGTFQP